MIFHHIGIATSDINESIENYKLIGYSQSPSIIFNDINQQVRIAFMTKTNSPLIEIVAPLTSESHLVNIISKIGTGPYHTCYEVNDIYKEIKILKGKKFTLISNPTEAVAFENRKVAFLFSKFFGIIEILEK